MPRVGVSLASSRVRRSLPPSLGTVPLARALSPDRPGHGRLAARHPARTVSGPFSRHSRRGPAARAQATVEFALVAVLLLLLVVVTVDLARLYVAQTSLATVVREAARYGAARMALGESVAVWQGPAQAAGLNLAVGLDRGAVALVSSQASQDGRAYAVVSGSYPFQPLAPFIAGIFGSPITLTAETRELAG